MATMNFSPKAILGKTITVTTTENLGLPYPVFHELTGEVVFVTYDVSGESICLSEHGYLDLSKIEIIRIGG